MGYFQFEPWRGIEIPSYHGLPRHIQYRVDAIMDDSPHRRQGDAVVLALGEVYGGEWAFLASQVSGSYIHGPTYWLQ